jgi:PAS domain S-box-containing protein
MSRKPRIMIVEDERISAEDLRVTLEGLGFEVAAMAATGEAALAQAAAHHPDLALMDIVLQGSLNGISTAVELRRRHDLPVIYITAYSDPDTVERIKESEPYGYIHKPFDFRELQIVIETALIKHRMERMLREREEWFSTTLKSIGDGVIAVDPKGIVTFMNGTAESMTGWTLDEAKGLPVERVFRIVNEQTKQKVENPAHQVLREGRVIGTAKHTVLLRKDGKSVPIDDSGAPILNGRGEITGVVLVFKDITEKRKVERILSESENRYRQLVEMSPDPILKIGLEGRILFANRKAASNYGYKTPELMKGIQAFGLVAPECHEAARKDMKHLAAESRTLRAEYTVLRKDGSRFPVEINASSVLDSAGGLHAFMIITRDVSDRHEALKHIKSLSRFPEESPSPVLRVDRRGGILYANPASRELLAFWKREPGKKVPVKVKKWIDFAVSGKAGRTVEVATGERTYSIHVVPVEEEDYINLYGRDVTLQKQVEALRSQHLHEQTVLALASKILMNIRSLHELHESLASLIKTESGADYLVLVEYDALLGGLRINTLKGLDKAVKTARPFYKRDLKKEIVPLSRLDVHRMVAYMSRRLIPVNDGLHELTAGRLSRKSAHRVERLFGIQDLWVMGFNCQGKLAGGIALFFKSQGALRNRHLIESIVNQASSLIPHLISERMLRDSETRFRRITETIPVCLWILDEKLQTTFVNQRIAGLLGYRTSEMIGRPLSDFMVKEDFADPCSWMREKPRAKPALLELRFRCKNGKPKRLRVTAKPVKDDQGRFTGSIVTVLEN